MSTRIKVGSLMPVIAVMLPLLGCRHPYDVEVPATELWTPTGIDIPAGSEVVIEAEGSISPNGTVYVDADGTTEPWWNPEYNVYPGINHCALIARVGAGGGVQVVGTARTLTAATGGRLSLGINDSEPGNNQGTLHVTVTVRRASRKG